MGYNGDDANITPKSKTVVIGPSCFSTSNKHVGGGGGGGDVSVTVVGGDGDGVCLLDDADNAMDKTMAS